MKKMLFPFFLIMCLAVLSGLDACGRASSQSEKPLLVVSIAPLHYLFGHIAGNRMDIKVLVPRGANPETYEPTPSDIVLLNKAVAYAGVGLLDFERVWADRIASECPHLAARMLAEGVALEGDAGRPDPHVWMSPRNMEVMAENACRFLCHIDRKNASHYRANHKRLLRRIHQVADSVRALLPGQQVAFFSYHPTLGYFARDYGLKQIPIEEDGKEPSVRRYKSLAALGKKEQARVIFVQPEFGRKPAEWLAEETGLPIEAIDPLTENWEQELLDIASFLGKYASGK